MPGGAGQVRVAAELPYVLLLPPGEYEMGGSESSLRLSEVLKRLASGELVRATECQTYFTVPEVPGGMDDAAAEKIRLRRADQFLRGLNRLIRWYRVAFSQPQVVEITRVQISPVRFTDLATGLDWRGLQPLEFTPGESAAVPDVGAAVDAVSQGLARGKDPEVAVLNLLDAQYAHQTGRFREPVLLCWGAIDSTFSSKYRKLVADALSGEWSEARDYLSEFELPLKVRMSGMLHLVAGRSLFREPGLWEELKQSYDKRNGIIHRGESATEDDAVRSLRVAESVIAVMGSL